MSYKIMGKTLEQRSFPKGAQHNFYIYGEISHDINEYVDMITTMDLSEEQDEIHLYINTRGGSLDTTISLLHSMGRCNAPITTHADGQIASAGTLLFLAGTNYVVYPYATFMAHDGSGGFFGKLNENLKSAVASSNLIKRICNDIYFPFFSDDEIHAILQGSDFYCDSDEIVERINRGQETLEALDEAEKESTPDPEDDFTEECVEDGDIGATIIVSNADLESFDKKGKIVRSKGNIKRVKLSNGKTINIHIRNIKYV
jgi:ATP-dependent protease ClpP protease subunit